MCDGSGRRKTRCEGGVVMEGVRGSRGHRLEVKGGGYSKPHGKTAVKGGWGGGGGGKE